MMVPVQGDVWTYPYLWCWQHEQGETEGRKSRPTSLVAAATDREGRTSLFLLAITTKAPSERAALLIPQIECARAGLDVTRPLWVMLDEYNYDVFETSFYLEPSGRHGAFSGEFHHRVFEAFLVLARAGRTRKVDRTE